MEAGSSITLDGRQFSLLQFHFHLPSEHTVEGESYPMEVHFVHQADEGDLAVIGVFMDVDGGNSAVQSIWDAVPGVDEAPAPLAALDPNAFLPAGPGLFPVRRLPDHAALLRGGQLGGDYRGNRGFAGTGRCLRGPVSDERASGPAAPSAIRADEGARGLIGTRCSAPRRTSDDRRALRSISHLLSVGFRPLPDSTPL